MALRAFLAPNRSSFHAATTLTPGDTDSGVLGGGEPTAEDSDGCSVASLQYSSHPALLLLFIGATVAAARRRR